MSLARRTLALSLACALATVSAAALAQTDVAQAKAAFGAGSAAYDRGDFLAAIQAFEQAEKLAPRPAIVFSIAQAHRRQYYLDSSPDHLKAAVAGYRDYVSQAPNGTRRGDAAEALAELGPIAERIVASSEPPKPPPKQPARISINATGTPNAHVSLDGAAPVDVPLISVVTPGPHKVKVIADGFVDEVHDVAAVEGTFVAQDFPLKEKPALLAIKAAPGARVDVDGRPMGTTPVAPISLPAGTHLVAIAKNGHDAVLREVDVSRGESRTVDASTIPTSTQRKVATGFLAAGALGVIAGGVFTGLALDREGAAQTLSDKAQKQNLTDAERQSYDSALTMRDNWSGAAFIGFSAGVALAVTGALLYAFDQPSLTGTPIREKNDERPKPATKPDSSDFAFAPSVGPAGWGASLVGRF